MATGRSPDADYRASLHGCSEDGRYRQMEQKGTSRCPADLLVSAHERTSRVAGVDVTGPVVEILGPWIQNKGDELMLTAVMQQLQRGYRLAASTDLGVSGTFANADIGPISAVKWRASAGEIASALTHLKVPRAMAMARRNVALAMLSEPALSARRIVDGRQITALLDCSGFAYGDQWSTNRLVQRMRYYALLKAQGVTLILLPQALGPFTRLDMRKCARALFENFDLLYARDESSLDHLRSLDLDPARLRRCPDITHLLPGIDPAEPESWRDRVCVVPNARMMDKTSPEIGARYLSFVVHSVVELRRVGLTPCLVIHERNDADLARAILDQIDFHVDIIDTDSCRTKGILGRCHMVLSSRYHALVSALSQGVPAIGTSWSHKYDGLFDEYGCSDDLVSPAAPFESITSRIKALAQPDVRNARHRVLAEVGKVQQARVAEMWSEVGERLEPAAARRRP
jgi:polysaccharide pyruvyl transferase WcaK-like protein